jgi:hypothetical protein
MAITILQSPQQYTPVYNGLPYLASSNNYTQPNMTLKVNIKNKITSASIATLYIPPRLGSSGKFVIDPSVIIESLMSYDLITLAGWQKSASWANYEIDIQEHFGTTPAPTGSITTVSGFVFNGSLRYADFLNYLQSDYLVDVSATLQKYLTNAPLTRNIRQSQPIELGLFTENDGSYNPVYRAVIRTYDSAGNLIQTATADNPYNTYSNIDERFLSFMCGADQLNTLTLTTGSQPLIYGGVYKYTITMEDDDGPNPSTETRTFVIDRDCQLYPNPVTLYFLNILGRFDAIVFDAANKQRYATERQSYKRTPYNLSGSTYALNNRGEMNNTFTTTETESWTLRSGFISEDEYLWLSELIASPVVFMQIEGSTQLMKVNIRRNDFEILTTKSDRLFQIEVPVEFSSESYRQK